MRSRRAWSRIGRLCLVGVVCVPCGVAGAQGVADVSTASDELLTAQNLVKLIVDNQKYAIAAGVFALLGLLAIAYLVPVIRAPRWQIVGFAVLPALVAFGTMAGLSRPIEPSLEKIPYEEMDKVRKSEVAPPDQRAVAETILTWQGELQARSFLADISVTPLTATFAASVALVLAFWFATHFRVLRAS
jgi:hypothetical protein